MRNKDNINFYYCVKRKKLLKGFCFNILVASWNLDYTKRANFKIKMLPGKEVFWNTGLFVAREQTGICAKIIPPFWVFLSFVVLFVKTGICLEQPWGHWQHLLAIDSNWNQPPFPLRSACIFSRSGNKNWDVVERSFPRVCLVLLNSFFHILTYIYFIENINENLQTDPFALSLQPFRAEATQVHVAFRVCSRKTELSKERVKAWNHSLCAHHLSAPQLFPSNHFSFHCSCSKEASALCIQSEWDEKSPRQAEGAGHLPVLNPFGCSSTGSTGAPLVPLQGENRTSTDNFSWLS